MFGFLKDKLKSAINKFSKDVDEESEEIIEEPTQEPEEKPKEEESISKEDIPEVKEEKTTQESVEEIKEETKEVEESKKEEKEESTKSSKDIEEVQKETKHLLDDIQEEELKEIVKEPKSEEKVQEKSELEVPLKVEDDEVEDVKDKLPKPKELKEEINDQIKEVKEEEKFVEEKKSFFQKIKDKIISRDDDVKEDVEVDEKEEQSKVEEKLTQDIESEKTIELKTEEETIDETDEEEKIEMIVEDDVIKKQEIEVPKEEEIQKEKEEKVIEKVEQEVKKFKEEKPKEKKGFFKKIADSVTKTSISESKFNDLFWELEIVLLENNVAVEVIEKIKDDLKEELVTKKARIGKTQDVIIESLQKTINSLFEVNNINFFEEINKKKPYVIIFVGVNGVGKTTTIAKVAHMLLKNNKTCVMAAGDTFRAAAIQQLEEHAKNLNVRLISHDYGSDPAAVAFDSIKYAEAKGIDVVLIDTAGRQHSNSNLMAEMKKIGRVATPDMKIFVGESITGNDCVEQAKSFNDSIGIDAMILTKADVDEKGGAAISISYITKKPILFIGTGQEYDCLKEFNKEIVTENLGLN
jgi:fused signal recognition particle receptor